MTVPRAAIPLLLVLSLAACAQTFDASTLGVPATLATAAGQPAAGDRLRVSSKAVFALWGIARFRQPSPTCGSGCGAAGPTSSSLR